MQGNVEQWLALKLLEPSSNFGDHNPVPSEVPSSAQALLQQQRLQMLDVPMTPSIATTMPYRLQAVPAARPMSVTSRSLQVLAPEVERHTLCEGCHEAFVLGRTA